MNKILLIYLLAVNLLAFMLFGVDKWKAVHGKWRIQESALLGISLIGGAAGGLAAMHLFRHKVRKIRFNVGVTVMLIVQSGLLLYLLGSFFT